MIAPRGCIEAGPHHSAADRGLQRSKISHSACRFAGLIRRRSNASSPRASKHEADAG